MAVNVEEVKMSDQEKLKLIDELLSSIDASSIDEYLCEADDETNSILNERSEKYQSGNMKFFPLEDIIGRLREKSAAHKKQKE